jgi:hypothetical protein
MTPADEATGHEAKLVTITIDRDSFEVPKGEMTGAALRELPEPNVPADRDLWEDRPGDRDRKIEPTDVVKIKDHLRFFTAPGTINPGSLEER